MSANLEVYGVFRNVALFACPFNVVYRTAHGNSAANIQTSDEREDTRRDHIKMTPYRRCQMLRDLGFDDGEIQRAIKIAYAIQRQREETKAGLKSSHTHERIEQMARTAKIILTFGLSNRKERAFLSKHVPNYNKRKFLSCSSNSDCPVEVTTQQKMERGR